MFWQQPADGALDALLDTVKLIPFLYLSYLLMEVLERHAGERTEAAVARSGRAGPLLGALLGVLPQCGFSAAGAGLYAGRVVSLGTLLAVFLSTSDEMLPVLIAGGASPMRILKILGVKVVVAALAGFATDGLCRLLSRRKPGEGAHLHIDEMCRTERCHCEGHSVWLAALIHTAQIALTVLAVAFALNMTIALIGQAALENFMQSVPALSCLLSALVGLIPNCAASVAITELYLSGVLSAGAMLSGLLCGAGIGLLVLFRVNRPVRDSLRVLVILFGVSLAIGLAFDALSLGTLLCL